MLLQKIMLVIVFHWLFSSVLQFREISWLFAGVSCLVIGILYRYRRLVSQMYHFLMQHKLVIMGLVLIFQISLLLSAQLLIRRDAAVVFLGAFDKMPKDSIANYLTRNPNNLPLFLYERFFYHWLGDEALWILQGLNLFYTHITGLILYKGSKRHFGQQVADRIFSFYVLLLGFSPYFMATYTDMMTLPLLSLQLMFVLDLLGDAPHRSVLWTSLLLGSVTGLALAFRPTVVIVLIAFYTLLFFKKQWKKMFFTLAIVGMSMGLVYGGIGYGVSQQREVTLVKGEGLAKGPLLFINLGLTFTGTNQADMKQGLLQYVDPDKRADYNNGMFKTEYVVKEIKRRLGEYTPLSFLQHMEFKERRMVDDGTLGWLYYRDISKEKTPFVSPLYPYTESFAGAEYLRQTVIYTDGKYYWLYAGLKQIIWIFMVLGLVFSLWKYKGDTVGNILQLAIFGGLLFLMIFEGGKGRYLIQFLPQILLFSSLGWQKLSLKDWKMNRESAFK